MKRILYFIGLKVLEIGLPVAACFGLGLIYDKYLWPIDFMQNNFPAAEGQIFLMGLLMLMVVVMFCMLVYLAYEILKANWKYAEKLADK